MEQNLPIIIAKKFWNMVRVALFMLRKGICKSKLLSDLNLMMKRGKIAGGKALQHLMFHPRATSSSSSSASNSEKKSPTTTRKTAFCNDDKYFDATNQMEFTPKPDEYEFSCSNSPANNKSFHLPFHIKKRKNTRSFKHAEEEFVVEEVVMKAIEMLKNESIESVSMAASPALPGFGKSPVVVRQLRVTDSPFPLNNVDEDNHVDEAAEKFIKRFYKNLKKQNSIAWGTPGR